MDKALTERQKAILGFILDYYAKHHQRWPNIRQIADHFGMNPGAAHAHTKRIEAKGYLLPFYQPHTGRQSGWLLPEGAL